MGLRREFSVHRRKTIESFGFVRSDISSISNAINNIKDTAESTETKISKMESEMLSLQSSIGRNLSALNLQQASSLDILSKIKNIAASMENVTAKVNSVVNNVNNLASKNQKTQKNLLNQNKLIRNLMLKSKTQFFKTRSLDSSLKAAQKEIKKTKNLLSIRLRAVKKVNLELETTVKKQKNRIAALNKNAEGKKIAKSKKVSARKAISQIKMGKTPAKRKRAAAKKTIKSTKKTTIVEPNKKTVVEVKAHEIKK